MNIILSEYTIVLLANMLTLLTGRALTWTTTACKDLIPNQSYFAHRVPKTPHNIPTLFWRNNCHLHAYFKRTPENHVRHTFMSSYLKDKSVRGAKSAGMDKSCVMVTQSVQTIQNRHRQKAVKSRNTQGQTPGEIHWINRNAHKSGKLLLVNETESFYLCCGRVS